MKKGIIFCGFILAFLSMSVGFSRQPERFLLDQYSVRVAFKTMVDSKKVSNQCCYCSDGTVYSYAADCIAGTVGCTSTTCPAAPEGCSGGSAGSY